jgi:nucleoside-diphosphate-sugar epimerase
MTETGVLITGADGYLGSRLAARYLETSERPLVLWVRARDERERRLKQARLMALFGRYERRWRLACGDLREPDPFAGVEAAGVGTILHAAAHIRFGADRATAEGINVQGTARALAFARRCPRLEAFGLLSSIYAAGLRHGTLSEERLAQPRFANEYERSKWMAEELAFEADLPCHVFRVATVVAEDDAGLVGQYNFAHKTLELLYRGFLSVFPGRPEAMAYLVTAEMVTRAVKGILDGQAAPGVWHLCSEPAQALSLDRLLDVVWAVFLRDDSFRLRRPLRPRFLDEAGFDTLSAAMARFARGSAGESFAAVRPFARQLYVLKDIRNDRLAGALGSRLCFPDPAALLASVCAGLVASRWTGASHTAAGRAS